MGEFRWFQDGVSGFWWFLGEWVPLVLGIGWILVVWVGFGGLVG